MNKETKTLKIEISLATFKLLLDKAAIHNTSPSRYVRSLIIKELQK